jgi:hypothetical protein
MCILLLSARDGRGVDALAKMQDLLHIYSAEAQESID